MIDTALMRVGAVGGALLLAGFAATPSEPARPAVAIGKRVAVPTTSVGLVGANARTLVTQFGQPDLDVREGAARKLQFAGPACVLDAYLYPPPSGGEPVVTHVDARLADGRDTDQASCAAALSRPGQAR